MIKITKTEVFGFEHAIRGMRNALESWDRSDSCMCRQDADTCMMIENGYEPCKTCIRDYSSSFDEDYYCIGVNDAELMKKLASAGTDHRKYMRMIVVYCDITAPLYWWKEYDTYKVGTVANSCSTMHKIHAKEFTLKDFSCEYLNIRAIKLLKDTVIALNDYRNLYVNYNSDDFEIKGCPSKKDIWWQMIQLLPSSYNQKRTVMLNYEVLANMYHSRKNHKLNEWREFCKWVEKLPYSEIIKKKLTEFEKHDTF